MFALIFQNAPNAMQSGGLSQRRWVIEFPKLSQGKIDPLTGTSGSFDMLKELNLAFDSKEDAIAYAKSKSIAYRLMEKPEHKPVGKSYGENFAYERKFPWTH